MVGRQKQSRQVTFKAQLCPERLNVPNKKSTVESNTGVQVADR